MINKREIVFGTRWFSVEAKYTADDVEPFYSLKLPDYVTIVAYSRMVHVSLQAAELLAKQGVQAEVLDLRSLRPLDETALIESVSKTHRAVVAYEGWPYGGVGAEIVDRIQRLAFDELDAPVARVCFVDVPMPYNAKLEQYVIPQAPRIIDAVSRVLYRPLSGR